MEKPKLDLGTNIIFTVKIDPESSWCYEAMLLSVHNKIIAQIKERIEWYNKYYDDWITLKEDFPTVYSRILSSWEIGSVIEEEQHRRFLCDLYYNLNSSRDKYKELIYKEAFNEIMENDH